MAKVLKKAMKKTSKKVAKTTKKVTKKSPAKTTKKVATKKQSAEIIKSGSLQVGDRAPQFTLPDQNGNPVSLKDFRGKNVLVYFYPKALTPGCTVQACALRDSRSALDKLDVVVLGISPDAPKKLKNFEEKKDLNFTLLADEDHQVAEKYGCWGLKKFMGREYMGILRQSFLIGPDGKILHVMHKVETKDHHQAVIDFFKSL